MTDISRRSLLKGAAALALTATFSQQAGGGAPGRTVMYEPGNKKAFAPATAAAVVFTGEPERVPAGLKLYMSGAVDHLLISGYNNKFSVEELLRRWKIPATRDTKNIHFD